MPGASAEVWAVPLAASAPFDAAAVDLHTHRLV